MATTPTPAQITEATRMMEIEHILLRPKVPFNDPDHQAEILLLALQVADFTEAEVEALMDVR